MFRSCYCICIYSVMSWVSQDNISTKHKGKSVFYQRRYSKCIQSRLSQDHFHPAVMINKALCLALILMTRANILVLALMIMLALWTAASRRQRNNIRAKEELIHNSFEMIALIKFLGFVSRTVYKSSYLKESLHLSCTFVRLRSFIQILLVLFAVHLWLMDGFTS